ncbi:hypothetical protein J6590_069554 [Homalodisca vitripennis]|nr:hypothetical protein J6590_069554 [Homalodisca vitripennis]
MDSRPVGLTDDRVEQWICASTRGWPRWTVGRLPYELDSPQSKLCHLYKHRHYTVQTAKPNRLV